MAFRLISHGATDVGLKRQKNEDYFSILEDEELYILADGMGGHASGQVASRLATEHITEFMTETCRKPGFQWLYAVPQGVSFEEAAVANAIQYANERTYIESMKDSRLEGMGTTVCVILNVDDRVIIGHVGDSRIYRYRDGRLDQMTRDHSLLNHYLDTGTITPEEVKDFKSTNVIVRAVGLKDYVDPEVRVLDKRDGDIYMMCSDGLSDLVDDWIIKNTIEADIDDFATIAQKLIRLANGEGGKDNITIVLVGLYATGGADEATDPLGRPAVTRDSPTLIPGQASPVHDPAVAMPPHTSIGDDAPTPVNGVPITSE